jgi:hypothetical protein
MKNEGGHAMHGVQTVHCNVTRHSFFVEAGGLGGKPLGPR